MFPVTFIVMQPHFFSLVTSWFDCLFINIAKRNLVSQKLRITVRVSRHQLKFDKECFLVSNKYGNLGPTRTTKHLLCSKRLVYSLTHLYGSSMIIKLVNYIRSFSNTIVLTDSVRQSFIDSIIKACRCLLGRFLSSSGFV